MPELSDALKSNGRVVLEAPPGAGKTTRVPPLLLDLVPGEVWVLEPRRLAARMAAARVAEERGSVLGEEVGYQVRFDERAGGKTRLRFVTEAILTRRLIADPGLRGVSAVVLDEFHERHIHTDIALALLSAARRDLKLVVMSATLDSPALADFLGAPIVRSQGRMFAVEVSYAPSEHALPGQIAQAVRAALKQDGDILVFLPGAADIRRAIESCRGADALLLPLYGELSAEEQDRAVRPAGKRKVVFATNVAETSITIDGIGCVIDSGLAKHASHAPWSGLPTLKVGKISQASAIQRAGRAGRTRAGTCVRLYSEHDFRTRPQFTAPEIRTSDLAETALLLADVAAPHWFEAPPENAWSAAQELLQALGALDHSKLTALGQRMRRLPLHPRQARLLLEAETLGFADDGCTLAALLAERDVRLDTPSRASHSDLLVLLEAFDRQPEKFFTAKRVKQQLQRQVERKAKTTDRETALSLATLVAFPDRVGRIRQSARGEKTAEKHVVFAEGAHGVLSAQSAVQNVEWVVAVAAEERQHHGRAEIRIDRACEIETDWLLDRFTDRIEDKEDCEWNDKAERVDVFRRLYFGQLVIEENRVAGDPEKVAEVLFAAAKARGIEAFAPGEALAQLQARVDFVKKARGGAKADSSATAGNSASALLLDAGKVLRELCFGRRSFADLREANLIAACEASLGGGWHDMAPPSLRLPSGRQLWISYAPGQAPSVSSRLQDFFGMPRAPSLAGGTALVIHLLAPNGRDLQVTSDLAGFWREHYPKLAPALRRRYPRHAWPEDPLHADPPKAKPPRR